MKTEYVEFLENMLPLKFGNSISLENIVYQPSLDSSNENSCDDFRRSKRQRKYASFKSDFYIYLVENEH